MSAIFILMLNCTEETWRESNREPDVQQKEDGLKKIVHRPYSPVYMSRTCATCFDLLLIKSATVTWITPKVNVQAI